MAGKQASMRTMMPSGGAVRLLGLGLAYAAAKVVLVAALAFLSLVSAVTALGLRNDVALERLSDQPLMIGACLLPLVYLAVWGFWLRGVGGDVTRRTLDLIALVVLVFGQIAAIEAIPLFIF